MRSRLDLQIPPLFIVVELPQERALDLLGPGVMTLDEVAVVGIHDAHDVGEFGRGARMQSFSQSGRRRREIGDHIGDRFGRFIDARWFDPRRRFHP
jgi:hypothetical protein